MSFPKRKPAPQEKPKEEPKTPQLGAQKPPDAE
eukprot:CAMPEP_0114594682 /NCGR_PEP_ID=MMETSP0125-20121206/16360_1 /TAXON_ID=485358 ORGANISM="Aristerostoma sp., Strain ATCC 50986" /NCGR_SAMPLE_ID=MMETSP0125 /ASSEMBLY_ACC=CAM_ASM_000245 /LENGTH=32 /DNA_ID= /DNA_START= /DNA_END= /DNA_ORIENTATION=